MGPAIEKNNGAAARSLIGAALAGVGVFILVMLPWPAWRSAYAGYFRSFAGAACVLAPVSVDLAPSSGRRSDVFDTDLRVAEGNGGWRCKLNSRDVGLFPSALYLALIAASSVFASFRWKPFVTGLLAIHVYIPARVLAMFLHGWTRHVQDDRCSLDHPSFLGERSWRQAIRVLVELDADPAAFVLFPLLIWALTQVDLSRALLRRGETGPSPESAAPNKTSA